ncbi:MAG TPA: HAMP domain-containing sensor histidine kinase [Chloroflexaceae bacterium]|nr:HAMP domain-containing sensor histidine kinase [Chloroflexaceae bacterium]
MTTLTTTPQVRLPVPRWMWFAAGAVVALGTLYLALYPLTLAWPAAVYLTIGQLHTVAFAVSTLLLARLSFSLPGRGGRWAARALLLSSLLAIGLDLQQRVQGREITEPSGIIVYVLVYLLNIVAVNCVFPRHQWHWRMALRRFSEVGIVMCVVYAGLQFTLPRLIPGWSWSPELTLACFRFVSTIGLATSALIIYRRYFVAGRPALVWGAIGLGCMLVTDLLIFIMTDVVARGGSARLMAVASPIWVIQHGCWLLALVQLRQSPLVWRDDATVQLPQSLWAWVRSTRPGLILVALALMVSQDTDGTLWIWFVVALIGREIIVAYERDVAAERQAAAQRNLEQAHERIRHLLALRTAHVKGATHDLSHGIVTFYVTTEGLLQELAAHGMEPAQVRDHRARVRAGIDLYKAMVQDLHDAALLEQDALKLQLPTVDMRKVVSAITQQLQPRFQQQECELTLCVPDTPVWAAVDEPRIERVVMNLLLNALNAIDHDRGAVSITLREEADAVVEVQDNGCGMDDQQLAVIRDRFAAIEQGDIPDSTGIGLNLCKRLIDAHGGRFMLRSTLGSGTTVIFALGRAPEPSEPAAQLQQTTRAP